MYIFSHRCHLKAKLHGKYNFLNKPFYIMINAKQVFVLEACSLNIFLFGVTKRYLSGFKTLLRYLHSDLINDSPLPPPSPFSGQMRLEDHIYAPGRRFLFINRFV